MMNRAIATLTHDAEIKSVLSLLKSPTLLDQIEPSGPG